MMRITSKNSPKILEKYRSHIEKGTQYIEAANLGYEFSGPTGVPLIHDLMGRYHMSMAKRLERKSIKKGILSQGDFDGIENRAEKQIEAFYNPT